jgi:RecB family endonuclease NucS
MTEINRFYSLNPIGNGWAFEKESECEDFVWFNLNKLLGIQPFKRQFYVKGQFCDLLGINHQKQLTILELKVTEDRYVVQQLTRYYHALIEQKPYPEEIDYNQKINLMALAPSFHQDSFTDDKYNILHIQFMTFSLEERNGKIYFNLKENDSIRQYPNIEVPYNNNDQSQLLADRLSGDHA